jgi:hypothetical protein
LSENFDEEGRAAAWPDERIDVGEQVIWKKYVSAASGRKEIPTSSVPHQCA